MDTANEIIELFNREFPTLPYFYDGDDGLRRFVYLGGSKCKAEKELPYSYEHKHLFFTLGELYEYRPLSSDGVILTARTFKKLIASCGFRQEGIYTAEEQEKYLRALSESELCQIAEQVGMYEFCREIYNDYYRKPRCAPEMAE